MMHTRRPPRLARRQVLQGLGLVGLSVVPSLVVGCGQSELAPADGQYEPLPGPDAVNSKLTRMVVAERWPATYPDDAPIKGAKEPLVTIVEYSDFECPFCGSFAATLDELCAAYPQDVRVVFQQFPMPMHPGAEPAARASIAAQAQGRFWSMHDRLFRERHAGGEERLVEMAGELGLDAERFAADLSAQATAERVADEQARGRTLGVRSTPNFFLNGIRVEGALKPDALRKVVDQERQGSQQLIDAGSTRVEVYARYMRAALDQHPKLAKSGGQ